MPAVLRVSGPDFINKQGETVKPRALIQFCETCNFEGAPFGTIGPDGKRQWYCGRVNKKATCVGKGKADERPAGATENHNGDGDAHRAAGQAADLFG